MSSNAGSTPAQAHQPGLPGMQAHPLAREARRSVRCEALKADGSRCQAWAMRGSQPPRCAAHGGKPTFWPGHRDAAAAGAGTTGAATAKDLRRIEDVVADLAERQQQLTSYLEQCLAQGVEVEEIARLFALHGQNASRLGRLLRDQQALSGQAADGLLTAIGQALDELSAELGIRL